MEEKQFGFPTPPVSVSGNKQLFRDEDEADIEAFWQTMPDTKNSRMLSKVFIEDGGRMNEGQKNDHGTLSA